MLLLVVAIPCEKVVLGASVGGIVLDSINFLAHAYYGVQHPNDAILWTLIGGFGWHALYLLSYVGIMRWRMAAFGRVSLRIFGMLANNVANEFFLAACRADLYGAGAVAGVVDLREWAADAADGVLSVWTSSALVVLRTPEGREVDFHAHAPYRTAYVGLGALRALHVLFPLRGHMRVVRRDATTLDVRESVLCAYCVRGCALDRLPAEVRTGFVPGWTSVRAMYWVCVGGTAVLLGGLA